MFFYYLFFMMGLPLFSQSSGGASGQSPLGALMPLVLIFIIFYFFLIRPQQKERKKHQEFIASLKKGQEVITSSGLIGTISDIKDNIVELEIANGVKVQILKNTIYALKNDLKAPRAKQTQKQKKAKN